MRYPNDHSKYTKKESFASFSFDNCNKKETVKNISFPSRLSKRKEVVFKVLKFINFSSFYKMVSLSNFSLFFSSFIVNISSAGSWTQITETLGQKRENQPTNWEIDKRDHSPELIEVRGYHPGRAQGLWLWAGGQGHQGNAQWLKCFMCFFFKKNLFLRECLLASTWSSTP